MSRSSSFFFQAEDGIRDYKVTGVQTCALPILGLAGQGGVARGVRGRRQVLRAVVDDRVGTQVLPRRRADRLGFVRRLDDRSEERRVGEEGRSRWSPYHLKKKKNVDAV